MFTPAECWEAELRVKRAAELEPKVESARLLVGLPEQPVSVGCLQGQEQSGPQRAAHHTASRSQHYGREVRRSLGTRRQLQPRRA